MKKILFINACVRPESRTYQLAQQVLTQISGNVNEVDLERENIRPLDSITLQERERAAGSKDYSAPVFNYAKQFADADEIVVAAPYWDLSFPSTLKIYFEAITVCGITFEYTEEGRLRGLCKAKNLIYVTTAGGPVVDHNLGYDYIKALAHNFYEISHVKCYQAEKLDIVGADVDQIMMQAMEQIRADQWN